MDSPARPPPTPSSTTWVHEKGPEFAGETTDGDRADKGEAPPAKRRKERRERLTRVSRACDRCKSKKTRCTGRCPCELCIRASVSCSYTAQYTRGRLPSIAVDDAAVVAAGLKGTFSGAHNSPVVDPTLNTIDPALNATSPSSTHPVTSDGHTRMQVNQLLTGQPEEDTARDPLGRSSPEPTQTDRQGHYIGPASGVSFLLRIQKKLHENNSWSHDSSIFTFGDAPLPEFDPTFFVLPPKQDAQRLVERYFDFAAPTHRFLHRPSIEKMLHEFYETQGDMRNKEEAASKTALLLIVFAQAQAYMPQCTTADDNSARYYFAAEHQLGKERGAVKLASVQARLVQCYYLLAQSRINQCWSLFGTTAHLALAIGLNRGRPADAGGKIDYIELECRRRTFWSAYVLDKFLSAALGRPRTFRDEDIDQELPTVVNDDDLHTSFMKPSSSKTQSIMMAPVEHVKLSQIISSVLGDLYGIRPPSMSRRLELAAEYSDDLRSWRARISRFLDAEGVDSSLLIPLYQRQRNVLNLAYYHTMLLVHRPFLLSNFASLANIDARPDHTSDVDTSSNIRECLAAAMGIVRIVDDIFQSSQIFRAFWFTQYYAFCAVVVLYIYRIQQHLVEPGKCEGYFTAGQRCQAQLSSLSDTDCLSKRYCLVLEELRLEAARQTNRHAAPLPPVTMPAGSRGGSASASASASVSVSEGLSSLSPSMSLAPGSTPHTEHTPGSGASTNAFSSASAFYGGTIPPTPESTVFSSSWLGNNSFMEDFTSWGQFDSLVTAGIGVLDGSGGLQGEGGLGAGFAR